MPHLSNPSLSGKIVCPGCGDFASRVPRKLIDRLRSLIQPVKRYRCDYCDWRGIVASGTRHQ